MKHLANLKFWHVSTGCFLKHSLLVLLSLTLASFICGCTFAQYSRVEVQVVDGQTRTGIAGARIRTFYIKPMLDMTYQRKDSAKTDPNGFATLTVATNWSQRMIFGWTHGIIPGLAVRAKGYHTLDSGINPEAFVPTKPVLVLMTNTNKPKPAFGQAWQQP